MIKAVPFSIKSPPPKFAVLLKNKTFPSIKAVAVDKYRPPPAIPEFDESTVREGKQRNYSVETIQIKDF